MSCLLTSSQVSEHDLGSCLPAPSHPSLPKSLQTSFIYFSGHHSKGKGESFWVRSCRTEQMGLCPFLGAGEGWMLFFISSLCSSLPDLSQPSGWRMIYSLAKTTTTTNSALCCYWERAQGTASVGCWLLTFAFLSCPPFSPHSPLGVDACENSSGLHFEISLGDCVWKINTNVSPNCKCSPSTRLASAVVKISRYLVSESWAEIRLVSLGLSAQVDAATQELDSWVPKSETQGEDCSQHSNLSVVYGLYLSAL